ncbi:hypothetical protein THOG11_60227 [Vibrio harveyi]|nr:hypothetical protein TH15OA1_430063 [Vibrio harveyi]CAH1575073.1 hypothetical protein THOD03_50227 [Vibrio harveyi]CAH1584368.1 hypothetical protein THOG11_60227 [Vibrio harveyi]
MQITDVKDFFLQRPFNGLLCSDAGLGNKSIIITVYLSDLSIHATRLLWYINLLI